MDIRTYAKQAFRSLLEELFRRIVDVLFGGDDDDSGDDPKNMKPERTQ